MAGLPQDAADPGARAQAIIGRRALYNFQDREGLGMKMLAPLNSVPAEPLGSVDVTNWPLLPASEAADDRWWDANVSAGMNSGGSGGFAFVHNLFMNKMRFRFDTSSHEQRLDNFYSAYVAGLGRPSVAGSWFTDQSFCDQRLCGANPVKIRQVRSPTITDDPFDCSIDASHFGNLLDGTTLPAAIDQQLVYVCDYVELAPFVGSVPGMFNDTKYLTAPIAVFFWRAGSSPGEVGRLAPVAIQLERGQGQPVFVPSDTAWRFAKAAVQTADAIVHEIGSHLIRSHAAMEPFPISAARTLSDDHPLYQLLKPHFKNFLQINSLIGLLTDEGAIIDILFPLTHADKAAIARAQFNEWNFNRVANPVNEIADRFMDTQSGCPVDYPYRDDAMLLWDAIKVFVGTYIDHWYPVDANDSTGHDISVEQDFELQAFGHSLIDEGEVRQLLPSLDPNDMPGSDRPVFTTRAELATFISTIIFNAGPYHSAVNYPQYDMMAWIPNAPFAGYLPPPTDPASNPPTPGVMTIEDHYPPDYTSRLQTIVMYALSYQRYDRFGHYPPDTFDDVAVLDLVKEFQCDLAQVEATIAQKNLTRRMPYPYLLPQNITNATSI